MTPLANVSDLATLIPRDLSAADTATGQLLLDIASADIRNYTRQTLSLATTTVKLHGNSSPSLVLPERPVLSVDAVTYNGIPMAATTYTLSDNQLGRGPAIGIVGNGPDFDTVYGYGGWGLPRSTIEVTYTHGYATIPDDIRGVCLAMARRAMLNPTGSTQTTVNMGPAQVVQTFPATLTSALTAEEKKTLDLYRKRATCLSVST